MLHVENLNFQYRQKKILENLSFDLPASRSVCLLGKNGVGKSTLFKCLLGILKPAAGNILINDQSVSGMSRSQLAKKIAYIPQNFSTVFSFSVFEMVLMGTTANLKTYQQPGKRENALAEEAIDLLKIRHLRDASFNEISGGEQQLTIIARSVAQQSKIIIMDEPCANLDYGNQVMVLEMIRELTKNGYLVIQATHDPNHAFQYGDDVLILQDGKLAAFGPPDEVLTKEQLESMYRVPIALYNLGNLPYKVCVPEAVEEREHVANV